MSVDQDMHQIGLLQDSEAPDWVLAHVNDPESPGCWLWTGYRLRRIGGHGGDRAMAKRDGKVTTAARHIWTEMREPLPAGIVVRHVCDQAMCVRPGHLLIGRPRDNTHDAQRRGRLRPGGRSV